MNRFRLILICICSVSFFLPACKALGLGTKKKNKFKASISGTQNYLFARTIQSAYPKGQGGPQSIDGNLNTATCTSKYKPGGTGFDGIVILFQRPVAFDHIKIWNGDLNDPAAGQFRSVHIETENMLHKHILPKQPKGSKKGQVMRVQVPTVTRYAIIHFNDTHNPGAREHCITEIKFGISSGMRSAVKKGLVKFKKVKKKKPKKYRRKNRRYDMRRDKVYDKIKGKKKYKGKPKWIKLKFGVEADDLYEKGISGFTDHMDFCTGNIAVHALASSKDPEWPEFAVGHYTLKGGRHVTARYDTVITQNPANPVKFKKKKIKPFTKTADLINVFDIHAGGKYNHMDRQWDPGTFCLFIQEFKLYPKKK